jgi:hypothetical protein
MQYDHFKDLVALVSAVPTYLPNEGQLQVANITTYKTSLLALNDAVVNAAVPYTLAIGTRNDFLYNPNDCLSKRCCVLLNYMSNQFSVLPTLDTSLSQPLNLESYKL